MRRSLLLHDADPDVYPCTGTTPPKYDQQDEACLTSCREMQTVRGSDEQTSDARKSDRRVGRGDTRIDDIMLVILHHVSRGGWQLGALSWCWSQHHRGNAGLVPILTRLTRLWQSSRRLR